MSIQLEKLPFDDKSDPQSSADLRRRADWIAGMLMALVLLACAFAWRVQPQEPVPAPHPQTVSHLHPRIASVAMDSGENGALEILVDQDTALYEASAVTDLAKTAMTISAGLKKYFPEARADKVRFIGRWPVAGMERFVVNTRMLELTFSWEELMADDFDASLPFQEVLNQAEAVGYAKPEDRKLVEGFCNDPIAKTAGPFCRRALDSTRGSAGGRAV
ncbi:hypothetical protein [Variovorax sp. WDL1]|nr:hypothetical protein [Variovorax sp. WDL1]